MTTNCYTVLPSLNTTMLWERMKEGISEKKSSPSFFEDLSRVGQGRDCGVLTMKAMKLDCRDVNGIVSTEKKIWCVVCGA